MKIRLTVHFYKHYYVCRVTEVLVLNKKKMQLNLPLAHIFFHHSENAVKFSVPLLPFESSPVSY